MGWSNCSRVVVYSAVSFTAASDTPTMTEQMAAVASAMSKVTALPSAGPIRSSPVTATPVSVRVDSGM